MAFCRNEAAVIGKLSRPDFFDTKVSSRLSKCELLPSYHALGQFPPHFIQTATTERVYAKVPALSDGLGP
jgi:hypothetical protein